LKKNREFYSFLLDPQIQKESRKEAIGIIDSFKLEEGGEQNLIKFIEDIDSINPQGIADLILAEACSKCKDKPVDDMTVLVAKVWKR